MESLDEMGIHVGSESGRVPRDIPNGSAAWDCELIGWGPLRPAKKPDDDQGEKMVTRGHDDEHRAHPDPG